MISSAANNIELYIRASTGRDQHLSTFSNGQVETPEKEKVASVSAGLSSFANIIKKHILCEPTLGDTPIPGSGTA